MINMKYFTVPAAYSFESVLQLHKLNQEFTEAKVQETYGQITIENHIGSGRAHDLIPQVDINQLQEYISFSDKWGIRFNYTLNTTCMGNLEFTKDGLNEIKLFLQALYDAGVRSLTIAMPSLIEYVHSLPFKFEIKASTVCQITNVNKAMSYKQIGADKIVLDESINRNFSALESITNAFGDNIEIIVNVICHKNCIYEMFHHNQTSHDINCEINKKSVTYYSHRCMMKRCESPETILKLAWIRPEDINYYVNVGLSYFKIQGRQASVYGDVYKTVKAYMQGWYDGDLMRLLDCFMPTNSFQSQIDNRKLDNFLKPFVNGKHICKDDCTSCHYCETYMNKHFDVNSIKEKNETANMFYQNYDEFIRAYKN